MNESQNSGINNDVAKFNWFNSGMPEDIVKKFFMRDPLLEYKPEYKEYLQTAIKNVQKFAINWREYFSLYNEILEIVDNEPLDMEFVDGFIEDLKKYKNNVDNIADFKSCADMVASIALLKANYIDRLLSMLYCRLNSRIERAERAQNKKYKIKTDVNTCNTIISKYPNINILDNPPPINLKEYRYALLNRTTGAGPPSLDEITDIIDSMNESIESVDYIKDPYDEDQISQLQKQVNSIKERIKEVFSKLSPSKLVDYYDVNRDKKSIKSIKWAIIITVILVSVVVSVLVIIYLMKSGKLKFLKASDKVSKPKNLQINTN